MTERGTREARARILTPMFFALNGVAMLCLGAGIFGLLSPAAPALLSAQAVAWSLVAVGAVLDAAAISIVLGAK